MSTDDIDDRRRDLAARALAKWGELLQLVKAGEELSECSAAVSRAVAADILNEESPYTVATEARCIDARDSLATEIADAEIVLEQLRQIYAQRCEADVLARARVAQLDKLERAIEADT